MLDASLLKSGNKKPLNENVTNTTNVDLERKRASHIMHYLMERKQEQDYADPFELLKNMTDVINAYEPKQKKYDLLPPSSDVSEVHHLLHFIKLPPKPTDDTSVSPSKRPTRPESTHQTSTSRLGHVKTFKQRQEERMLDIRGVINEVSVDQLEAKHERIKKLREEFNEIKLQFSSQQQMQTIGKEQQPNKSSSTRRLDTISREYATQGAAELGGVRRSFVKG